VFGEGVVRNIMIVGEGPGTEEEQLGRPFIGKSGGLLRRQLGNFGLNQVYFTNTVLCRSCEYRVDADGNPVVWRGVQKIDDKPPLVSQIQACRPRLLEEIYLVDPLLIIAAGGPAAETLLGGHVAISKLSGEIRDMEVPGRSHEAVLTDKKQLWRRKVRKQWVTPTRPFMVKYPVLLMVHPAYALRYSDDHSYTSPMYKFTAAIGRARDIMEMREKVYGGKIWESREELDEC
jgi:uracil-DNA glycosylase family 4